MPRKAHTEEQIMRPLREAEGVNKGGEICREMGLSQQAFYLEATLRRLGFERTAGIATERKENCELKTLVANLTLDKRILQEVLSKA